MVDVFEALPSRPNRLRSLGLGSELSPPANQIGFVLIDLIVSMSIETSSPSDYTADSHVHNSDGVVSSAPVACDRTAAHNAVSLATVTTIATPAPGSTVPFLRPRRCYTIRTASARVQIT